MDSLSSKIPTFELWETTFAWLKACGNKVNSNFCKEEITSHPDYPSLLSVIDFLEMGGLSYKAIQKDRSYIHDFNYPLLAHIKQPGEEHMHLISDADEWDKKRNITDYWSGIVVYPDIDAKWNNEQNEIYQRNELRNKIIVMALGLIGFVLFIVSVFQFLATSPFWGHGLAITGFGLLSLAGITISLLVSATELGFQSQIAKQVCGVVSTKGCEQVLKSRYAKGIAGITPADISVVYFASQFVVYLFGCWFPSLLQSVFLISFGGIAIAALSFYTQAAILKQWCALCLAIVVVLIAQSVIALVVLHPVRGILPEVIFMGLFIFLILSLVPIKQLIKINSVNKYKLVELRKWKSDGDLFLTQWKQEKEVDTTIWHNDLLLGNPNAPVQITVACNLYCKPCAKAHEQLDHLLHNFGEKIKIQIRLLSRAGNENDIRTLSTQAILEGAALIKNDKELQKMLSDWFKWMDPEKWQLKWLPSSTPGQDVHAIERMMQHRQWIEQSQVVSTPMFFINGRKLPGRYSINDLGMLIPHLAELRAEDVFLS